MSESKNRQVICWIMEADQEMDDPTKLTLSEDIGLGLVLERGDNEIVIPYSDLKGLIKTCLSLVDLVSSRELHKDIL